ncbi:hypothetical protein PR048_021252 [Dryococelus australis]|uniref:YqaJ viral recombinase domain-containing protein n=1 Tax=Dryococelus australis TaxID=614101 RepID=A0ABQ9GXR0_9NEOP|nr:hypothetical protein PR048_021252 [Dryococelus australis]
MNFLSKNAIHESLDLPEQGRIKLQEETALQSNSHLYKCERRKRITASWVGKICKLEAKTSRCNTVKSILYSDFVGTAAMKYDIEKETLAVAALEETEFVKVQPSGTSIDKVYCFIGASPDGLIDSDGIVRRI